MFYHVTHPSLLNSILKNGLNPNPKNQVTINLNNVIGQYLDDSIIDARVNGVYLYYSKDTPDFTDKKFQKFSILEVTLEDTTENTYCADSSYIDPIMQDVVRYMYQQPTDLNKDDVYELVRRYEDSWGEFNINIVSNFTNPEVIYVGSISPHQLRVLK
ncbi:hypothetical protein [Priestia megaterium]|uniref:hypothetical protein n=1 Tax=Priestia megaterium TaxID=1404 RepID=UPI001F13DA09|nr:hypothetical protein [Priestia megaterium]UMZ35945.1 hypothetical protein MGJ28_28400 [Priestia megaterium]